MIEEDHYKILENYQGHDPDPKLEDYFYQNYSVNILFEKKTNSFVKYFKCANNCGATKKAKIIDGDIVDFRNKNHTCKSIHKKLLPIGKNVKEIIKNVAENLSTSSSDHGKPKVIQKKLHSK